jgi:hypothetical protein
VAHGDPSRPEAFFDATLRRFEAFAAVPGTTVIHHLALGDRVVRLVLSAGAMERAIMPALVHLETAGTDRPDLEIMAWDSDGNDAPPVSPGWTADDLRGEGYIAGFNDSRFHTAYQSNPIILRMIDLERRQALYWTRSAARLPIWERGAPMRPLLHEWLGRVGFVAVHGGAVGRAEGGVFLAGIGGRGKSNLALACLSSPLLYASDDFCFLSPSPRWTVHSLYSSGKVAADDLIRHPALRDSVSNPDRLDQEKALFFLAGKFGDRLIRRMELRAIVLPRVTGVGPSRIVPVPRLEARKETAISTFQLSRWSSRDSFGQMSAFVDALPCFAIELGDSLADAPPLLARLIDELP